MINRVEIVRPSNVEARLPILTDQQVQEILRSKIDAIRRNVKLSVRIGRLFETLGDGYRCSLFYLTGEESSCLKGVDETTGKVESERLQRLGFEVMREYGFDENNTRVYRNGWKKNGTDFLNGISREYKFYPSKTIDGLTFERTRTYAKDTGKTLSVAWEVVDSASLVRIKSRKKVRK